MLLLLLPFLLLLHPGTTLGWSPMEGLLPCVTCVGQGISQRFDHVS
jgi:hypothetical protein